MELLGSSGGQDDVEDTKLSSGEGSNHDASCGETDSAEFSHAFLGSNSSKTGEHTSFTTSALLVDLREKGIGGMGDNGGHNTSNDTRLERDSDVLALGELVRRGSSKFVDRFSS